MDSRIIQLTAAAQKYGNLNISSCGRDFFPPDVFGCPSKKKGVGVPITIKAQGISTPIRTDIPTDSKTGKPRWIFRQRSWVKEFVKINNLNIDSIILFNRISPREYFITMKQVNKTAVSGYAKLTEQPGTMIETDILFTIKEASEWATKYLGKNVTTSNISYLIQYGLIKKIRDNGTTQVSKQELLNYYKSYNGKRQVSWKDKLGDDLNWALSFEQYKETETTKHVHRLYLYSR